MLKKAVIILILVAPISIWAFYKPVRILMPAINGVTCVSDTLCLEDIDRVSEAGILYEKALKFVNIEVEKIKDNPRVIFCMTERCNQAFGFHPPAKAHTIGVSGIVVSPWGWNETILRHEMIHHLQAEQLGVIKQWRSPNWFKEGMAYSLSQDARPNLTESLKKYKSEFEKWLNTVGKENLWKEASRL